MYDISEPGCSYDDRQWYTFEKADEFNTIPAQVKDTAIEGLKSSYRIDPQDRTVCIEILGTEVYITQIHFTVKDVDFVRITLYKGNRPIAGQVRNYYFVLFFS